LKIQGVSERLSVDIKCSQYYDNSELSPSGKNEPIKMTYGKNLKELRAFVDSIFHIL